jgi:hypothetical protein
LISQSGSSITAVDKSPVAATSRNRGKFVESAVDLIRRKFSVDVGFGRTLAHAPFGNHNHRRAETLRSPSARNEAASACETVAGVLAVIGRGPALGLT